MQAWGRLSGLARSKPGLRLLAGLGFRVNWGTNQSSVHPDHVFERLGVTRQQLGLVLPTAYAHELGMLHLLRSEYAHCEEDGKDAQHQPVQRHWGNSKREVHRWAGVHWACRQAGLAVAGTNSKI